MASQFFSQEGVSNVLLPTLCDIVDKSYRNGDIQHLFKKENVTKERQKFQNSVMAFLYKLFIEDHLQRHSKELNDVDFQIRVKLGCEQVRSIFRKKIKRFCRIRKLFLILVISGI